MYYFVTFYKMNLNGETTGWVFKTKKPPKINSEVFAYRYPKLSE